MKKTKNKRIFTGVRDIYGKKLYVGSKVNGWYRVFLKKHRVHDAEIKDYPGEFYIFDDNRRVGDYADIPGYPITMFKNLVRTKK
jgi:hypothetical protein